jgi:TfoX/Sxy family transcriptional regulator of competence genes
MEWKKVSQEMVEYLDTYLADYKAERKQMFGCPAYFINGNMFAGVQSDSLFIRLSGQDQLEAFIASDEVTPFEPVQGRVMKDYVVFPEPLLNQKEFFTAWLDRSFRFTSALPPKIAKTPKNKDRVQE